MTDTPPNSDWHSTSFGEAYRRLDLDHQSAEKTTRQVACVLDALSLPAGSRVLDLGCGTGRHSLALAREGLRVVGLDINEEYVREGSDSARSEGVSAEFVQGDMRDLSNFEGRSFDAVVSLYTSFGYFSDRDNLKVLEEISGVLKLGGSALVDVHNRDWFLRTLKPSLHENREPEAISGDYAVDDAGVTLHEAAFQPFSSTIRWTMTPVGRPGKAIVAEWRSYCAHEIYGLLSEAGLTLRRCLGDYDCSPFHALSPRIISIAVPESGSSRERSR